MYANILTVDEVVKHVFLYHVDEQPYAWICTPFWCIDKRYMYIFKSLGTFCLLHTYAGALGGVWDGRYLQTATLTTRNTCF